jgi:hypothetical protein
MVSGRRLGRILGELPSEVRECLVGISHTVSVLAFGDGCTFFSISCHEFIGEFGRGRATLFVSNCDQNPAEG